MGSGSDPRHVSVLIARHLSHLEATVQIIDATHLATQQIDTLETLAQTNVDLSQDMRDVLMSLAHCLRDRSDVMIDASGLELTPTQVAERLRMSRTHLYKLLDRGEIPFHRVGRDRRIRLADLAPFEERRQHDRRQLAEAFASQDQIKNGAIDELADLL